MVAMDPAGIGRFVHRFQPAAPEGPRAALLLLHGTGGDENDLVPLAGRLAPGAAFLSPRGRVLERGMPRWFARIAEGVFDEDDLERRAGELAEFVQTASARYGIAGRPLFAVGFSNGANIAAAMLLLHPDALAGAVLLRAMLPFAGREAPDLSGRAILIASGRRDPMVPAGHPERLAAILREAGAEVTLQIGDGGHGLAMDEVDAARDWLAPRI
jgi:phospholipase/carboxylesterase